MKKSVLSFALALISICFLTVLTKSYAQPKLDVLTYENDLSQDGGVLCDYVFSDKGELISASVYNWDETNDCKGEKLHELFASMN